jgi:uncharacterized membrane protein
MSALIADRSASTPQWLPATRVGSSPRRMFQGARVFVAFAVLLLTARRIG